MWNDDIQRKTHTRGNNPIKDSFVSILRDSIPACNWKEKQYDVYLGEKGLFSQNTCIKKPFC